MKKHLLLLLMLSIPVCAKLQAQFVTLPDTNFRNHLMVMYPTCFNAAKDMDTTCNAILSTNTLSITSNVSIVDIEGVKYFDNLDTLHVNNTQITYLPELPNGLIFLNCQLNQIDTFLIFPPNLKVLMCQTNQTEYINNLPITLEELHCDYNELTALPALPNGLKKLYCSNNQLSSLPALNPNLLDLNCSNNSLTTLPTLPSTLERLDCNLNSIASWPVLPSSLLEFYCTWNNLSNLPSLPPNLTYLGCSYNQLTSLPTLPSSLENLTCIGNQLTNLPSLPVGLESLSCDLNFITALPMLPATLTALSCRNNILGSLPQLPSGLVILFCDNNPLNNLPILPVSLKILTCDETNLSILPNLPIGLINLSFRSNSISSLPSLPVSLETLYCGSNPLGSLPNLPTTLIYLEAHSSQLTSLPSLPNGLHTMYLYDNPLLTCLPLLPNSLSSLNVANTGISCVPNITANYANWSTLPLCSGGSACEPQPTMAGVAYEDMNANNSYEVGVDSVMRNWVVTNSNGWTALTNQNGEYQIKLDSGVNNLVQLNPLIPYCTINPTNYSINPTSGGSQGTNYHFKVQFTPNIEDLKASIAAGPARPGFDQWTHAAINNVGTTNMSNVTLKVLKPASFTFNSAVPVISAQIGDTLIWTNINMAMFDSKTVAIDWNIPSTTPLGNPYQIEAWVLPTANDANAADNHFVHNGTIVGSYDPNDKAVNTNNLSASTLTNELTYTIRFQNTGTDTAFNIVIKDTLSNNLDWSTFKMLQASHNYNHTIRDKGLLEVFFPNILLPDSNINEKASHGFFQYSIKPKASMAIGASIKNTAYIYFDFNAPIITNTVSTTYGPLRILESELLNASVYPNPVTDYIKVQFVGDHATFSLFDMAGKLLMEEIVSSGESIPVHQIATGSYICSLRTDKGVKTIKILVQR